MLTLAVQRPAAVYQEKMQAYRVILTLSGIVDPALFVCVNTGFSVVFDHVATAYDLQTVTTDPTRTPFRTPTIDVYTPSKQIADLMIEAIIADLRKPLAGPPESIDLSGATI
jgi:hypothetical protein